MSRPKKIADDLEAVRVIAQALAPFTDPERDRILRWAKERSEGIPCAAKAPRKYTRKPTVVQPPEKELLPA